MPDPLTLHEIGRLPAPDDNVAIAIRQIQPGSSVHLPEGFCTISHTVLEGHRFAIRPISIGEPLLSWDLTFGHATRSIAPGDYVCNDSTLKALRVRQRAITLPEVANFADHLVSFALNETALPSPAHISSATRPRIFQGYRRPGNRGVGTRNNIVILGTSSRTASFARQLTARLQSAAKQFPGIDGIVAVAHTEGGDSTEPNNAMEILRTIAGFMVHPNVGAVLAVDHGTEAITNARLQTFMPENGYASDEVPHEFLSTEHGLSAAMSAGEAIVQRWLPDVSTQTRSAQPLSELRIALQCGGSDAFSGVSGNPLAGAMTHEIVRHGGMGVLCETDEIVGAEDHLMRNIKSLPVAKSLLSCIARFKERMRWHGVTPESNPSAGNKFRGLYNITLKSLGAVQKKDPRTPLDHVIDYAVPIKEPGFYFMDSPGNDLEAIGGQVGSGCNLVIFVTGNGSITNFPFVPTLKITTTTRRHKLLEREMDINAGKYLDGESFESLTQKSLDLLIETASGKRSKGEEAGHYQSSLWRNWQQKDDQNLSRILSRPEPSGVPLPTHVESETAAPVSARSTERVGLVLPTSMCSSQIARMAAVRMNEHGLASRLGFSRFVALPHSEGCGFGGETMYQTLCRTYRGYATHPNVGAALLLEHGCEKIPNDAMRRYFESTGLPLDRFGWASVQLDGGIERTLGNIEAWFEGAPLFNHQEKFTQDPPGGLCGVNLGLASVSSHNSPAASTLAEISQEVLQAGGSVLIPESDPLLADPEFLVPLLGNIPPAATLANGASFTKDGFHVVQTDSDHWVENLTSLGACGAHLFVGLVGGSAQQGHPLLSLLQLGFELSDSTETQSEVDLIMRSDAALQNLSALRGLIEATLSGDYQPIATAGGFVDFQFARGPLGVSA